jgi:hypothetical protein
VAALMAGWTGCDTRNLYAAAAEVQSANSAAGHQKTKPPWLERPIRQNPEPQIL